MFGAVEKSGNHHFFLTLAQTDDILILPVQFQLALLFFPPGKQMSVNTTQELAEPLN